MSETLHEYYLTELRFIRDLAKEFAGQYPGTADRLNLGPGHIPDPHVERLIQAFALLAGRIHHKLNDDFPELTDALLSVLYPHYLAPIPSMAIIQFALDAGRAQLPDGFSIDRQSRLRTQPIDEQRCFFRTCYPVTLWPITVQDARLKSPPFPRHLQPPSKTAAVLTLRLECQAGMTFSTLSLDRLRFFLSGDNQIIPPLYELLFNNTLQVDFRPVGANEQLAPVIFKKEELSSCLYPVGFERDEGLLPYPNQSFLGYRLLTEFFTFPYKFWFVDLGGFDKIRRAGFGKQVDVIFYLNRTRTDLEQAIEPSTFSLGCTPVINLFEKTADAIDLTHAGHEHRVVPDRTQPKGLEVYSIDSVDRLDSVSTTAQEYQPFYSFRHGQSRETQRTFWYASRRPSMRADDNGTDVFLSFVDLDFQPAVPENAKLIVRTTCTNRDLPKRKGEALRFELEPAAPVSGSFCLRAPTAPLRPPLHHGAVWRLLSHLNLNHLSLSDAQDGRAALQEILGLYDFSDPESGQQQLAAVTRHIIEGITAVSSRRVVGRVPGATASGFCRGLEVDITFDEQKYAGVGVYLFACVLERFLGLYASINSFTQLVARTNRDEGLLKTWRPRAAELQLL